MGVEQHGLGRRPSPDHRDRRFAMSRVVPVTLAPKPRQLPYHLGPTLDQGDTSQCVGFSNRHKLTAAPIMVKEAQGLSALDIYIGAQDNDEWEGHDYEGTSVRGAFKFLASKGFIGSYVWATTVQEAHVFLWNGHGTVVNGTDWTDDMFNPDEHGFVHPTGAVAGGHAYHKFWSVARDKNGTKLAVSEIGAADLDKSESHFQNSWGEGWGIRGRFRMTWREEQQLLDAEGECGAGIELKVR